MAPRHGTYGLLLLVVAMAVACHAEVRDKVRHDHSRFVSTSTDIAPGTYDLLLKSTHGHRKGRSVRGRMTLHRASPDDVSPRTGERPDPRYEGSVLLYGSTDVHLRDVNVPLLDYDTPHAPSPESTDPIYPGVLVERGCIHDRAEHVCLSIGTASNTRNGTLGLDGAGIMLWIDWVDGPALGGVWDAAGIRHGDSGTWTAKRAR